MPVPSGRPVRPAVPRGWRRTLAIGGMAVMALLGGCPTPARALVAAHPAPGGATADGWDWEIEAEG